MLGNLSFPRKNVTAADSKPVRESRVSESSGGTLELQFQVMLSQALLAGTAVNKAIVSVLLVVVVAVLPAQDLRIDTIEFLGLRKVTGEQIRSVLGLREGDVLPMDSSVESLTKRIEGI